jgi:predicted transcriptional regulator
MHLKRANVEYAKMMAKVTDLDVEVVKSAIDNLLKLKLIERDSGSALKRSKARFKKAFEVHKHHTYYRLSREGELFVRKIDERWLKSHFDDVIGRGSFKLFKALIKSKTFQSACKELGLKESDFFDDFLLHRFITPNGKKTKFFKAFVVMLGLTG